MNRLAKEIIRKIFRSVGMDVHRYTQSPQYSLLGIKHFPIKTILDVGANEGQFSRMISRIFPMADLYCFEPLPGPFNKLKQWGERRGGKVHPYNIGIGEEEGEALMFKHTDFSLSSSFLRTTETNDNTFPFTKIKEMVTVKVSTLDNFAAEHALEFTPEILVKIDVQGYEDRVIRGGRAVLRRSKACILEISFDDLYEKQATFKSLYFLMDELGFHYRGNLLQSYGEDGHVVYIDAVFIK